jgi:dUTPase
MSSAVAKFAKIDPEAVIPTYAEKGSVACDLYLFEKTVVYPGEVVLARTGIVAIPPIGYHWELCLRSSTPVKNPLLLQANALGLIDFSYIGPEDEIKIPLLNARTSSKGSAQHWRSMGEELKDFDPKVVGAFVFEKGTRIAQMILRENLVPVVEEISIDELRASSRGGFGSTGK